jgi:SAM-dependent methyltransferase
MSEGAAKSTERFSDRVEHYVRYRPGYPDEVIGILRDEVGWQPEWTIADIGSGTGISAELFLRAGNTVYGVEPNAAMRAAAEKQLAKYAAFHSSNGTAEATTLPPGSVDCVVAAQAFHWFDAAKSRAECLRILRPDGAAALLWNARLLDSTPFLREYEQLLLEFGTDYARVRHERIDKTALVAFFGSREYSSRSVENLQRLDWDGLRGRLLSSSYVPAAGESRHDEMLGELKRLYDRHQRDGCVRIEYDTQVFVGRIKN